MSRLPIIQPDQSYTFEDYFRLNYAPGGILACFDVTLHKAFLTLPQFAGPLERLGSLRDRGITPMFLSYCPAFYWSQFCWGVKRSPLP